MNIEIHNTEGEALFKKGDVVFKIIATEGGFGVSNKNGFAETSSVLPLCKTGSVKQVPMKSPLTIERNVNMVTTKEDYHFQLQSHVYSPLLYMSSFYVRLAYLYDCLNRKFAAKRDEKFTFWIRYLGQLSWEKWFTVHPYGDEL